MGRREGVARRGGGGGERGREKGNIRWHSGT